MPDSSALGQTATIEVRVYQYGLVKAYEWCATEEQAAAVVERWNRERGIHCEIIGLPR